MSYPEFDAFKAAAPKEPTGTNAKKEYWVGCYTKDDWVFIHEELKKDGSLEDNIPTSSCECPNECQQSDVRGVYMLTDTEVNDLRNHSRVKYVHINALAYPGTYADDPDILAYGTPDTKTERYASAAKHCRNVGGNSSNYVPAYPGSGLLNRGCYQILRGTQKVDPWWGKEDHEIIDDKIEQYGTGVGVDAVILDTDMWFGHIEFLNLGSISNVKQEGGAVAITSAPGNYIGKNVLQAGFSTSSTTGFCGVLDVLLDGPYYIDAAWFEGDVANRLMTRWDGTRVPTETAAKEWWSDSSKRSVGFSTIGTISSSSMSSYTRVRCNGSDNAYNTGGGTHGTPCASQVYGRSYGWAYNANKWFINIIGSGVIGYENTYDVMRIFHTYKPINPYYNTKDPTITSNSWGLRQSNPSTGYYYHRQDGSGTGGVEYNYKPAFIAYYSGDGWERRSPEYVEDHASIDAGKEMTDAGVIWVCSAGNNNQKMVYSDHPDYNNYVAPSAGVAYTMAMTYSIYGSMNNAKTYNSQNRPGYPAQLGVDRTTTPYTYPVIQIGALDDDHKADGREEKVWYSNMGEAVACFSSADQTIGASRGGSFRRYDAYYDNPLQSGRTSAVSRDTSFGGTSSACPTSVGIMATKLQYNRDWTHADIKDWLKNVVEEIDSTYYYPGTETASPTDTTNWGDYYNMHGGPTTVIYDAPTTSSSDNEVDAYKITGPLTISGSSLTIST